MKGRVGKKKKAWMQEEKEAERKKRSKKGWNREKMLPVMLTHLSAPLIPAQIYPKAQEQKTSRILSKVDT